MFNAAFTQLLLVLLAAILVVAAAIDVRTFTISNRLNLTVALLAPVYWLSVALSPWPGMAVQLAGGGYKVFTFADDGTDIVHLQDCLDRADALARLAAA